MTDEFDVDSGRTKRMHSPQVRGFTHLPVRFKARRSPLAQ
jgi:hypothetical protein